MNKRNLFVLLSLIVTISMMLSACGAPATEAPATEVPTEAATEAPTAEPTEEMPAIGSPEHPIKVLFVPSVDANIITTGCRFERSHWSHLRSGRPDLLRCDR